MITLNEENNNGFILLLISLIILSIILSLIVFNHLDQTAVLDPIPKIPIKPP